MNGTFQTVTNESTIFPFRGRGLRIPSLSEFLDAFPNHPKNIEIKDNSVVAAEMLWRELKLKGEKILKRVIVSCRFAEPLQHFRRLSNHKVATSASEPEVIKIVVLAKLHISNLWYLYDTLPKSLVALQIPTQSGVLRLDQHHIVNAIHKLGLRVHYWVVNNPQEMARLIEMGVDGIITDRSDLASQLLRRHLRGQQLLDERMSLSLIDLPIEKSFINSTEGFFIPEYLEPELHTCVSLLCRILQNVYYYIFSFVGILTLVVILLWRCK
jgi:glycerophosphoryl diester phosphodiesterase